MGALFADRAHVGQEGRTLRREVSRRDPGGPLGHALGLGPGAWPFVDRDGKLQAVLEPLGGHDAGAVVVSAPHGTGRTRLAQQAVAVLRAHGRPAQWVTGTRAEAAIPLGALAHLFPVGTRPDPSAAWQTLATSLGGRPPSGRTVIGIDDAHLLDDLSAALVHKIVLTRLADVVVTLVAGAQAPGPVQALWRDGMATRVELHPLQVPHVEALLTAALDGVPESRTTERLAENSQGSAVLLHEVVEAGRETARLRNVDGMWRWEGDITLTERLREVVLAQIGDVVPEERTALELVAIGGQLGLEDLVAMTSADVVASLERRGLVLVEQEGRHAVARLAQPLHAQVLCADLPQAVTGALRNRLVEAASVHRWVKEDPIRVGTLLSQLDGPPRSASVLARAAAQANVRSDHEAAERLALAALEERPDPAAWVALAEALRWQGRPAEAERASDEAAGLPMDPIVRDGHAVTTMLNLFFGLGRADDAQAVARKVGGHAARTITSVGRLLRLSAGEPIDGDDLPDVDLSGNEPVSRAALLDCILNTHALALLGETDGALASATQAWPPLQACTEETEAAAARASLMLGEWLACELGGRIVAAERRAAALHRETMDRPGEGCDAIAALGRGSTALAAGRLTTATRWLTEATIGLSRSDPLGQLPLAVAKRAQAHALRGDTVHAEDALRHLDDHPTVRVSQPETFLAQAWFAAASGESRLARTAAWRAAESAHAMGQRAMEARALDVCARLGLQHRVCDRLEELSARLEGRVFRAYAMHAAAAARQQADELEAIAAEFEDLEMRVLAADTYARAAEAHRSAGHRRRAAAAGARATALARECGGLHTPTLSDLAPFALSSREREIATLAAQGVSNRTIARQLVLSVRTVETHLAHVYDKLGISSRAALAEALAVDEAPY